MKTDPHELVLAACRQLMRPVIRILLRHGVMHRQFADLCKELYVEVAGGDYGLRGRPTNTARVALLTGLDRKEVKRVRDLLKSSRPAQSPRLRQDRISRVLSGWYQDPQFSVEGGPLELAREAGDAPSFAALVQRYGGDVPASTLLKELKRFGAVETTTGGRLRVLKRYYMPAQSDVEALQRAGSVLRDLGDTVVHNLYRPAGTASRFEGRATNAAVNVRAVESFCRYVEEHGQQFLEQMDAWLTAHEAVDAQDHDHKRLGLGLYWIEGPGQEGGRG